MWNVNKLLYALYQLVTLPVTLSDPNQLKSPVFYALLFVHDSGTAEARVWKFCTKVGRIKY